MRGYSFSELVRLAEGALQKTGGVAIGHITAPNFLVSEAQGESGNSVARRDFVEGVKGDLSSETALLQTNAVEMFRRSYVNAGFLPAVGSFEKGTVLSNTSQVLYFEANGKGYTWSGAFPKTVPAGSTPNSTGGVGEGAWRDQSNAYSTVTPEQFGAVGNGTAVDTNAIQMAIDYVYNILGTGTVLLTARRYKVAASSLNEVYDNFGVAVPASTCGIVLRKGVSLMCSRGRTKIICDDAKISIIALIAPNNNHLSGFELQGGFTGNQEAGHGIVQLGTQGGVDTDCRNITISDVYVHNVGSYGVSFGNGNPANIHLKRIRTDFTGADGLDLKARGDSTVPPDSNSCTDIVTSRQGMRVEGSAGIDVRGVWHLKNITAKDFGGNPTRSYTGIRFRTKPPITDPYTKAAAKSTLDGFTIYTAPGTVATSLIGVECGSDDVHISKGTVDNVHQGVAHNGNAVGAANNCTVTSVTTTNCTVYGFRNLVGNSGITYIGCNDIGSPTPFRMEGSNMKTIGCTGAAISISGTASPTFSQVGCSFGGSMVSVGSVNATTTSIDAKGAAADIALRLVPKGAGHLGMYGDLRPDTANTRYVGSGSLPLAGGFTQTAFTVTSDERLKTNITELFDLDTGEPTEEGKKLIAAWIETDLCTYQLVDRVAVKGEKAARWHFGIVAQRAIEAVSRQGLNWAKYAVFNHDEWEAVPEEVDELGNIVADAIPKGDRYSINYEEALMLGEAARRWQTSQIQKRLERLEALLEASAVK